MPIKETEKEDFFQPFKWRWYLRYLLAVAVIAFGLWLGYTMGIGTERGGWRAWLIAGGVLLYGGLLGWELSLATLGILALAMLWQWSRSWTPIGWAVLGFIALMGYMGRQIDMLERKLKSRIDDLQKQIDDLRGPRF